MSSSDVSNPTIDSSNTSLNLNFTPTYNHSNHIVCNSTCNKVSISHDGPTVIDINEIEPSAETVSNELVVNEPTNLQQSIPLQKYGFDTFVVPVQPNDVKSVTSPLVPLQSLVNYPPKPIEAIQTPVQVIMSQPNSVIPVYSVVNSINPQVTNQNIPQNVNFVPQNVKIVPQNVNFVPQRVEIFPQNDNLQNKPVELQPKFQQPALLLPSNQQITNTQLINPQAAQISQSPQLSVNQQMGTQIFPQIVVNKTQPLSQTAQIIQSVPQNTPSNIPSDFNRGVTPAQISFATQNQSTAETQKIDVQPQPVPVYIQSAQQPKTEQLPNQNLITQVNYQTPATTPNVQNVSLSSQSTNPLSYIYYWINGQLFRTISPQNTLVSPSPDQSDEILPQKTEIATQTADKVENESPPQEEHKTSVEPEKSDEKPEPEREKPKEEKQKPTEKPKKVEKPLTKKNPKKPIQKKSDKKKHEVEEKAIEKSTKSVQKSPQVKSTRKKIEQKDVKQSKHKPPQTEEQKQIEKDKHSSDPATRVGSVLHDTSFKQLILVTAATEGVLVILTVLFFMIF